jgi:hypothetical protein
MRFINLSFNTHLSSIYLWSSFPLNRDVRNTKIVPRHRLVGISAMISVSVFKFISVFHAKYSGICTCVLFINMLFPFHFMFFYILKSTAGFTFMLLFRSVFLLPAGAA